MNSLLGGAAVGSDVASQPTPSLYIILKLFANSLLLGVILCVVTYTVGRLLRRAEKSRRRPSKKVEKFLVKRRASRVRALVAASNLLFLCVGLTGTMILVNNTMVRAFAVGAAIALVRFKVNLNGRDANSALLFGILSGIACGLNELTLAWTVILLHAILSTLVGTGPRIIAVVVPRVKGWFRPIVPLGAASLAEMAPAKKEKLPKTLTLGPPTSVLDRASQPIKTLLETAQRFSSAHMMAAPMGGAREE